MMTFARSIRPASRLTSRADDACIVQIGFCFLAEEPDQSRLRLGVEFFGDGPANRLRAPNPPLFMRYCALDNRVGTMRCTLIFERSISSPTFGPITFFQ
jgi:hypothetical protein